MTSQEYADDELRKWQAKRFERAALKRHRAAQRIFTLWLVACFACLVGIVLTVGHYADPLRRTADIHPTEFTCDDNPLPSPMSRYAMKRNRWRVFQCASF